MRGVEFRSQTSHVYVPCLNVNLKAFYNPENRILSSFLQELKSKSVVSSTFHVLRDLLTIYEASLVARLEKTIHMTSFCQLIRKRVMLLDSV